MERMIEGMDRISTPRNLLLGLIATVVTFSLMIALGIVLVYDVYGVSFIPDTSFGYTIADIQTAFDNLGTEGVRVWLMVRMVDMIFPIAYTFAMVCGIMLMLRHSFPERKSLRTLTLLPIGGAIVDYIENILIASQALSYPNLSGPVIVLASIVTIMKWLLLYAGFAVLIILSLVILFKRKKS